MIASTRTTLSQIPAEIWMFGPVNLLMNISSEVIHSLLPVFMVTAFGANAFYVGFIEGVVEVAALIVKVFSDTLSDYLGKRKGIAALGYVLGALSKPFFVLASGVGVVLAARLADRIGKGIRGAPRDALVVGIAPPHFRGAALGLRQSLDTAGAFLGPLTVIGLMFLWANDFRTVFWVAVIPGILSVLLPLVGVREPNTHTGAKRTNSIKWVNLVRLGRPYWQVVVIGALFTPARLSEAFLVLRSQQAGLPLCLAPLVLVAMNVVYSSSTYPFGELSDRLRCTTLLAWGLGVLIFADLVLAVSARWAVTLAGVAVWGLRMGMTQGLLATMVADTAPEGLRGTAFGFFNLASGLALLVVNALTGLLWDQLRAVFTFYVGAASCVATIVLVILTQYGTRRLSPGEAADVGHMRR